MEIQGFILNSGTAFHKKFPKVQLYDRNHKYSLTASLTTLPEIENHQDLLFEQG